MENIVCFSFRQSCADVTASCRIRICVEDHVGVSIGELHAVASDFAHLFKNYTNMTFVDFLTVERVKLAETFFLNPRLRITDIAFESGFSSISSFNRSFKKIKGCSPTEFRATMID